jgi:hypothetical protein
MSAVIPSTRVVASAFFLSKVLMQSVLPSSANHKAVARVRYSVHRRHYRSKANNLAVSHDTCFHERRNAVLVLGIRINSFLHEELANIQMPADAAGMSAVNSSQSRTFTSIPSFSNADRFLVSVTGSTNQSRTRRTHGFNISRRS